jgi:hypothetical protein
VSKNTGSKVSVLTEEDCKVIYRGKLNSYSTIILYAVKLAPEKLFWIATPTPIAGIPMKEFQLSGQITVTATPETTSEDLLATVLATLSIAVTKSYINLLEKSENGTAH